MALGNGWWQPLPLRFWSHLNLRNALAVGPPVFKLALVLAFSDGSEQRVESSAAPGAGWLVGASEVLRNNIYLGTVVNRSAAPPDGWAQPGFAPDASWRAPAPAAAVPAGRLRSAYLPPVRRFPAVRAAVLSNATDAAGATTIIFDVGKQQSGVCRWCAAAQGRRGQRLHLRYGEVLYPNGSLNGLTSVAGQVKKAGDGGPCAPDVAWQADDYEMRGDAEECYAPPWTWHAFRFVELTGDGATALTSLDCTPMRTDVARTLQFASSSTLLNSIWEMECVAGGGTGPIPPSRAVHFSPTHPPTPHTPLFRTLESTHRAAT